MPTTMHYDKKEVEEELAKVIPGATLDG